MNDMRDTPRRQLGELGALATRTEADERRILEAAEKRLERVEGELDSARAVAMGAPADADRYQALIEERGRLNQVIAQARAVLEPDD
jgi:hypothetical protein